MFGGSSDGGGSKIIWVCGVIALLIFIASTVSGIVAHKKLREFHLERYATLNKMIPVDSTLDRKACEQLQAAGYTLTSVEAVGHGQPSSVFCYWIEEGKIKRIQSKRLGCPIYAEIQCDGSGRVTSVVGHEE